MLFVCRISRRLTACSALGVLTVITALAIGKAHQKSQNKAGNVQYSQVRNTMCGFWWQFVWLWDVGEVKSYRCFPGRARIRESIKESLFFLFLLIRKHLGMSNSTSLSCWWLFSPGIRKYFPLVLDRYLTRMWSRFPFAVLGWEGHQERNLREVGEKNLRIWSALSCLTVCSDLAWKFLLFGVPVVRITREDTGPLMGLLLYYYFYLGLAKPLDAKSLSHNNSQLFHLCFRKPLRRELSGQIVFF